MSKIIKKLYLIIAFAGVFLTATACARLTSVKIELDKSSYHLLLGDKLELVPTVTLNGEPCDSPVVFYSYDTSIVEFEGSTMLAKGKGTVRIKVYSAENSTIFDTASVVVTDDTSLSVEFSYNNTMFIGSTQKITYQFKEELNQKVEFTSENSDIANVDEEGNVTALSKGIATINVKVYSPFNEFGYKNYRLTISVDYEKYNISYELNGGQNYTDAPTEYIVDGSTVTLGVPTKVGYTFKGWELDGTIVDCITSDVKGDILLIATWDAILYDVTYELDGGTNDATNPNNYTIEDIVTLKNPTKVGYEFIGWFLNGEKVETIDLGTTGEITLVAQWKVISYSINYELGGGTNNIANPSEYTIEETFVLENPIKSGYIFEGWFLNGEKVETIDFGTTGEITLVAQWRTYSISEAKELNKGDVVTVSGIVIAIGTESILIQDGSEAIMIYKVLLDFDETNFVIGRKVIVTGEYTEYNGLSEIQYVSDVAFGEVTEVPEVLQLEALPEDENELLALQSKLVVIELTFVRGTIGASQNATFTDINGNEIIVRGDSKWGDVTTTTLYVGQVVTVKGFINWYNGAQITNVTNFDFITEKDEDIANKVLDSLVVPGVITGTIELEEIENLSWSLIADTDAIRIEGNQLVVELEPGSMTVDLEAIYQLNGVDYKRTFTINVVVPEPTLFSNGDQVIVVSRYNNSGNYYVLSGKKDREGLLFAQNSFTNMISTIGLSDYNIIWTVEVVDGNYYLKTYDGKYVSWLGDDSAGLSDTPYALTITRNSSSTQSGSAYTIASAADSSRKLHLANRVLETYFAFLTKAPTGLNESYVEIRKVADATKKETADAFLESLVVPESVNDDFSLPTEEYGSLTWSLKETSDVVILNGETVTVNRPAAGEPDATVVFVAKYLYLGIAYAKDFTVVVKAQEDPTTETKVTFTFNFNAASTTAFTADKLLEELKKCDDSNLLSSVSNTTRVYPGNSSNGQFQGTEFLKFGNSKDGGILELTFAEGMNVVKVEIDAHSWTASEKGSISVGNVQIDAPTTGVSKILTFNLSAASNVINISTTKRAFIFSITVYFA